MGWSFLFASLVTFAWADAQSSETWKEALEKLRQGENQLATEGFEDWRVLMGDEPAHLGLHRNLALANWRNSKPAETSLELLRALKADTLVGDSLKDLSTLSEVQTAIGIDSPITEQLSFQTHYLLKPSTKLILQCAIAWCIFIGALFALKKKKRWAYSSVALSVIPLIILALSWTGISEEEVAVLGKNPTPLWKTPDAEAKQVDLPEGLVVLAGKTDNGLRELKSPLAGWVEENSLRFP